VEIFSENIFIDGSGEKVLYNCFPYMIQSETIKGLFILLELRECCFSEAIKKPPETGDF